MIGLIKSKLTSSNIPLRGKNDNLFEAIIAKSIFNSLSTQYFSKCFSFFQYINDETTAIL